MPPSVASLDHLVLTVADIDTTRLFYKTALGMHPERFITADGSERWAINFGSQKINLHEVGKEFEPKALCAKAGSADLCFLSDTLIDAWITHLAEKNVRIEMGPVSRTGATGPIQSIYIRDPDGNLIEIANRSD